tara:strand:- start:3041 stop:4681 length:1641 start_codon:yes stop_codon:yes gene_type:complete
MKTLKELSKYTLARYQMGAADNLRDKGVDHGAKIVQSVVKGGDAKKNDPDREKRSQKMRKRVVGIGRAANKLTQKTNEDIEYIDELSPKTLGNYATKAGDDLARTSYKMGAKSMSRNDYDDKKDLKKVTNRQTGLARAARKLVDKGRKMKGGVPESVEYIDEDEKKYHYDLGHKTAMSGDKRGETSDNFGPYASHYNAGYDAGMKKRKSTKPKVVGKDSYGRDIVKVEGHKTKKKYLKDLKMTMNQATLGDMSTALQKGGFQGKGQYEETEILEDGHTDVASAMRKCKTIMEDAGDIQTKLAMMGSVESLPSWWTNKLAVAAAYMDSMRDYLLYPTNEEVDQIDELNVRTMRSYRDKAMDDYEDKIDPRKGRKLTSPEAKKRMQGIQRADDKIQTKKILQRQKMGVSEGRVKQDMIKKGYARGNRDVDPRMMIPKTKPKDKQMKLPLKEKHMTDGEMKKREKIVMAMKPKMKGFKDRYGDDAKNVMYATATKMAMKKEDTNLFEKVKKRKVNQKKLAGNDKFEADPTLTSQIMRPDNPSNDNDNKI